MGFLLAAFGAVVFLILIFLVTAFSVLVNEFIQKVQKDRRSRKFREWQHDEID